MRWRIVGNIFLFTLNILFAQTYIVKFKSDAADTILLNMLVKQSFTAAKVTPAQPVTFSVSSFPQKNISRTSFFPWRRYAVVRTNVALNAAAVQLLEKNPAIEFVQTSRIYKVYSIPNDSAFSSQWNLQRIGVTALLNDGTISPALTNVIVGVIDTGIDDEHPDLANVLATNQGEFGSGRQNNGVDDDNNGFIDDWRGYDFVDLEADDAGDWNVRDNDPSDENGHGTSVAGIIGAQANNKIGIAGIVPAKILPLRAFGKNGNGSDIDIATAIIYAADNGVDVINMSFGDVVRSSFLYDAVRYAYDKDIILVSSSGNDGSNAPHYPSDFSEVISTGAVSTYDTRSFFSSYSPSLDLMAPGEQISTTTMGGGYTDEFAGTSAAAPHVSGISALIRSIDKNKKIIDPSYVEMSNEDIRGILLNSAVDAGAPGWDNYYGAGIVNAQRAVQIVAGSVVSIHSPRLDEHLSGNSVPIIITAITPYLQSVSLFVGAGENPVQWNQIIGTARNYYARDTIMHWDISSFPSGNYILRLAVKNSKGSDQEFRQRVFIDQTIPRIVSFRYRDSVIIRELFGTLVEARTDRNTNGILYYRKAGEFNYSSVRSLGQQKNHQFILTANELSPQTEYEWYCQFTEPSATQRSVRFPTVLLAGKDHFTLTLSSQPIQNTGFFRKPYELPKGFLLNSIVSINLKPTVILNEYTQEGEFGMLKAFEFNGNRFMLKDSSSRSWIPRAFEHQSNSGSPEILVQEHGISQLTRVDTAKGKFFHNPVWGDSTDIWASELHDFDGDGISEIVARSSTEYLIYKKSGSSFTVSARFPNPSAPLSGEARNQFGPPKSISGNFTGLGKNEILFADYDGDLLLYRQSTPQTLTFTLIDIDTSDLYEMSDYITAGDFTGDGIQDFAVAGHSNLDWNSDREYDAPVWTVKVFSHTPSDDTGAVSMIWQQYFVGVKAGSGYNNGLVAVKLLSTDTQDALCISFTPSLYVVRWNSFTKNFETLWHHSSQSNSVIVYDFDGDGVNDLGFNTNGKTEFWSMMNGATPVPPYGLSAVSISSTTIRVSWNSTSATHNVYRGTHGDSLLLLATVTNTTSFVDSTLTAGIRYFYSVSALNGIESHQSEIVSVTPHHAPIITAITQNSGDQLSIGISFDVSMSQLQHVVFLLDSTIKSSGIVWKSSKNLLVTFPFSMQQGPHTVRIRQLIDVDGMMGDTTRTTQFVSTLQNQSEFFVRSVALVSVNRIKIEFSNPVNFITAKMSSNYSVRSAVRSYTVGSIDSLNPQTIMLNVSGADLTQLALRLEISINDSVSSFTGTKLRSGKGQVVSIAQETQSLEKIVVYPNPVTQSDRISFINIPANCRISIYTTVGDKIITFGENTTREGISWNLRTTSGNLVSTGIYLYRVEQMNDSQESIKTILGKFAVIR